MAAMKLRVALDWTPNTIHSGLYLAKANEIYQKYGLDVELLPPDAEYSKTPARRLEAGEVDLAICPSESCIAYHESGKVKLQAIYAILQKDASAIVSTKLRSMRDLGEGKRYGSYNARYEDRIVAAMVAKDGGRPDGLHIEQSVGKLGMFDAVKAGFIEATWIFLPWEGVEAESEGVQANYFKLADYDIPYGYSPVIARDAEASPSADTLRAFVAATREGYQQAMMREDDAVDVLRNVVRPPRSRDFLRKSQICINDYYTSGGQKPGHMEAAHWGTWLQWLKQQDLLSGPREVRAEDLFTNEFGIGE